MLTATPVEPLTPDNLRERFSKKFPDIKAIRIADLYRLSFILQKELDKHHLLCEGLEMWVEPINSFTFKMLRNKGLAYKGLDIKVCSSYFTGRQGITFTKDGKVWFCGWAGGTNHHPFLRAFSEWLGDEQ